MSLRIYTLLVDRAATKCFARGLTSALPVHRAEPSKAAPLARYSGIEGQREAFDRYVFRGEVLFTSSIHNHRHGVFNLFAETRAVAGRSQMTNESVSRRTSTFSTSARSAERTAKVKPSRFAILETGRARYVQPNMPINSWSNKIKKR